MIAPDNSGRQGKMIESEPIRRRKLSHEVLDRLLARITQGELAAGDNLPSERDLMSQYGVGRPAVREAMQALERMGLIAITHGERARIIAPTARTMIDQVAHSARHLLATSATSLEQLKEARVFFEAGMVRIAAEKASPADLDRLGLRLEEHEAAAAGSAAEPAQIDEFLQKDMAFHREIAAISGNAIYVALSQAIFEWLAEFHTGLVRLHGAEGLTIAEHKAILARIAAGDPAGAAVAMTAHLTRANELYRQFEREAAGD
jgi:GntR family transcriptional regulator, sialic acid-inducible nan operon repressor